MALADLHQAERQLIAQPGNRQHADDDAGGAGDQNEIERAVAGLAHRLDQLPPAGRACPRNRNAKAQMINARIAHNTAFSG